MDVSPDGLIANQMLRRAVTNFQNETGYTKIAQNAVAKAKAINAVKAQTKVIPRGPSVLDFKPPKEESPPPPPPPPKPKPATTVPALKPAQSVPVPDVKVVEPPTPTQDEPQTSTVPPVVVENTPAFQTPGQVKMNMLLLLYFCLVIKFFRKSCTFNDCKQFALCS